MVVTRSQNKLMSATKGALLCSSNKKSEAERPKATASAKESVTLAPDPAAPSAVDIIATATVTATTGVPTSHLLPPGHDCWPTERDVVLSLYGGEHRARKQDMYRSLIRDHWQTYSEIIPSNFRKKRAYVEDNILWAVLENNGPFLRKLANGKYEVLSFQDEKHRKEIIKKLTQALRGEKKRQYSIKEQEKQQRKTVPTPECPTNVTGQPVASKAKSMSADHKACENYPNVSKTTSGAADAGAKEDLEMDAVDMDDTPSLGKDTNLVSATESSSTNNTKTASATTSHPLPIAPHFGAFLPPFAVEERGSFAASTWMMVMASTTSTCLYSAPWKSARDSSQLSQGSTPQALCLPQTQECGLNIAFHNAVSISSSSNNNERHCFENLLLQSDIGEFPVEEDMSGSLLENDEDDFVREAKTALMNLPHMVQV